MPLLRPRRRLPRFWRLVLAALNSAILFACAATPTPVATLSTVPTLTAIPTEPPAAISAVPTLTAIPTEPPAATGLPLAASPPPSPAESFVAATNLLYSDALGDGWNDWSWGITQNLAASSPIHGGSAAIAVTYSSAWSGLKLARLEGLPASNYDTLRFWIHGGSAGGQTVTVFLEGAGASDDSQAVTPVANNWTQVDLPLAGIGAPSAIESIVWFNSTDGTQPVFYLDDISLFHSGAPTSTPPPPSAGPALTVDAADLGYPISPNIYGLNFADPQLAADLDLPINRWGGNATTRYNYQLDISNRASDWFFENIPNDNPNPGALPAGSASDDFIAQNLDTNTHTLLTVPLIGWTPKGPRERICGFSVALYGSQQSVDPYASDCGNGLHTNGDPISGNNPLDTSIAITPSFVSGWMAHLLSTFGPNGVRFYNLDNEPMLWHHTHRDVHPAPTSYDEMRDRTYAYAAAIKAADPNAQTLGPVLWGWTAYFYSALDTAAGGNWWDLPLDRLAHGNQPFIEWYLEQMADYEADHGVRILDYVDVHNYPQSFNPFGGVGNAATQALRLRSTRSLWDPTYVDESWIDEPVYLVPRMREWVAGNYPGTKLAITEYHWGALNHINGAVAQADILGIFGREGLGLATLWAPPGPTEPGAYAFRMYRNYDGADGRFGDLSVGAVSTDQARLAVYAARRGADGALTVMVINKDLTASLTSAVALAGFSPAPNAAVYRYSAANLNAIVHLPDQTVASTGFSATFPPQSITLFVLSPGVPLTPRAFIPALFH
jgi:hypothetical protein